mgnify:CR=1 FL=1
MARVPFFAMACLAGFILFNVACKQGEGEGGPPAAGGGGGKGGGKGGGGDVPVLVTKAAAREVPLELEVIGNVEASSTVMIKPQVSGELVKALFKEGDFVKAGTPLFEIDKRQLEAQLAQEAGGMSAGMGPAKQPANVEDVEELPAVPTATPLA